MDSVIRLPNLDAIVQPLLGTPYADANCWNLVRLLIREGFGLDLAAQTEEAAREVVELWYRGDAADPLTLLQPWDLLIIANQDALPVSDHVGLVVDEERFVHARNVSTGVAMERIRRYRSRLLQVARLRRLL